MGEFGAIHPTQRAGRMLGKVILGKNNRKTGEHKNHQAKNQNFFHCYLLLFQVCLDVWPSEPQVGIQRSASDNI
jgi:hypothetical protein